GEVHCAEQRSGAGPKMAHMRPAVGRATLVKPDAGNIAVTVGTEFQSEFHGAAVVFEGIGWRRAAWPDAARTSRRRRRGRGCESPCHVGGQSVARHILPPWIRTAPSDPRPIAPSRRTRP